MVNNCVPLMLTNRIGNKYPSIWENIDKIYEKNANNESVNYYEEFIQLIMKYRSVGNIIGKSNSGKSNIVALDEDIISLPAIMDAAYKWRVHKQIYKFPDEIETLLYNNETDFDIPIYILNSLPYDCIYIETNSLNYKEKTILGFFFYKDYKSYAFVPIFEDLSHTNGGFSYDPLNKDMTLRDGLNTMMDFNKAIVKDENGIQMCNPNNIKSSNGKLVRERILEDTLVSVFPKMLQLVLYICAENKEIEENSEQKKIMRKPKDKKFIKDKYREIQIWDCGNKLSEKIRTFIVSDKHNSGIIVQRNGSGTGKSKAPHSRRGHWHHFWTGKIGTEERRLILRCVAPTFVNGTPNTVNVNLIENG